MDVGAFSGCRASTLALPISVSGDVCAGPRSTPFPFATASAAGVELTAPLELPVDAIALAVVASILRFDAALLPLRRPMAPRPGKLSVLPLVELWPLPEYGCPLAAALAALRSSFSFRFASFFSSFSALRFRSSSAASDSRIASASIMFSRFSMWLWRRSFVGPASRPRPELFLGPGSGPEEAPAEVPAAAVVAPALPSAALLDSLLVFLLLNRLILPNGLDPESPMRKAAVCNAVAAAARRAWWFRCAASLVAQSGRTRSVVMTLGALADRDCVRLRPPPAPDGGGDIGVGDRAAEFRELLELIAVLIVPTPPGGMA